MYEKLRGLQGALQDTSSPAIANYTAVLLGNTSFAHLSQTHLNSIVSMEQAFRLDAKNTISEAQLVQGLNSLLAEVAPATVKKTSINQVRTLRFLLLTLIPNIVQSPNGNPNQRLTPEMSPASAIYIAAEIFEQKLLNTSWDKDPDDWARSFSLTSSRTSKAGSNQAIVQQASSAFIGSYSVFTDSLGSPGSPSNRAFQALLDNLKGSR